MGALGEDPRLSDVFEQAMILARLVELAASDDADAENRVRCYRDGVPPVTVSNRTINQAEALRRIDLAITEACRGRSRTPLRLCCHDGAGASHVIRWAQERAAAKDAALLATTDGDWAHLRERELPRYLISSIRIRGRALTEVLSQPPTAPTYEARKRIAELGRNLSPAGVSALTHLWKYWHQGRHAESLGILAWMRGELSRADSAVIGLGAKAQLADDPRGGTIGVVIALVRLLGASSLVVTVDGRRGVDGLVALTAAAPYLLLLSTDGRAGDATTIEVVDLSAHDRRGVARLIRNDHLSAYQWKDLSQAQDPSVDRWCAEASAESLRYLVRHIVDRLDSTLEQQESR